MASDKQIRYLLYLLADRGYGHTRMSRQFLSLGAPPETCAAGGPVADWLAALPSGVASNLIVRLKSEPRQPVERHEHTAHRSRPPPWEGPPTYRRGYKCDTCGDPLPDWADDGICYALGIRTCAQGHITHVAESRI